MNTQNFVNALLIGTLAGITVGLLFAPDKGSETRRRLAEKGNDLADAIKNKFGEYADDAEDIADTAGGQVEEWANKGRQTLKDLMDKGKNKADEFQDKASDAFSL